MTPYAEKNEEQETLCCRNCHSSNHREDFIHPCKCSGSHKWVHRKCLNEWRAASKNLSSFYVCDDCNFTYNVSLKPMNVFIKWSKLLLFLTRDFLLLGIVILILIYVVGLIPYLFGWIFSVAESQPNGFTEYSLNSVIVFSIVASCVLLLVGTICSFFKLRSLFSNGESFSRSKKMAVAAENYRYSLGLCCYHLWPLPYTYYERSPGLYGSEEASVLIQYKNSEYDLLQQPCNSDKAFHAVRHTTAQIICNCLLVRVPLALAYLVFSVFIAIFFIIGNAIYIARRHCSVLKKRLDAKEAEVLNLSH